MSICRTCHTDDARATKTECPACYMWRRNHGGQARTEDVVIKNNGRRLERELVHKRRLS